MSVIENLLVPLDYLGRGPREDLAHADEVLTSVRLEARRDVPAEALSQLELRKLELARALVTGPRLLIADEAMAGLSGRRSTRFCRCSSTSTAPASRSS